MDTSPSDGDATFFLKFGETYTKTGEFSSEFVAALIQKIDVAPGTYYTIAEDGGENAFHHSYFAIANDDLEEEMLEEEYCYISKS